MPYELKFRKLLEVPDPDIYWNECCWGGDHVSDRLLPMIKTCYQSIQHNQEDWGWFIWFKEGRTKLAVDIFCDDPKTGAFRILLTAQVKRPLFGYRIVDTDELLELTNRVSNVLAGWIDGDFAEALVSRVSLAAPVTELIDRRIFGKSVKKKKRRVRRKKGPASSRAGATV